MHVLLEIKILKYHGNHLRTFKVTVCVLISKGYKHNVKYVEFLENIGDYFPYIKLPKSFNNPFVTTRVVTNFDYHVIGPSNLLYELSTKDPSHIRNVISTNYLYFSV